MERSHDREIGALTEAVNTLKDVVESLRKDVKDLETTVATIKGGWKAISAVSALGGGIIATGLIKITPLIGLFPK